MVVLIKSYLAFLASYTFNRLPDMVFAGRCKRCSWKLQ